MENERRYNGEWKSLDWLKSYDREIWQFIYKGLLEKNWWKHITTCDIDEVKQLIKHHE